METSAQGSVLVDADSSFGLELLVCLNKLLRKREEKIPEFKKIL